MHDLDMQSHGPAAVAGVAIPGTRLRSGAAPIEIPAAKPRPVGRVPGGVVPTRILHHGTRFAHPAVLVDPRPESLLAVRSLRAHEAQIVLLSSRRLEPAMYARGAQRHRLAPLAQHPERWEALLLELAAKLEPRPLLFACSQPALEFLRRARPRLEPHYGCANLRELRTPPTSPPLADPDAALRRTVLRGEAALEVQVTRDASGRRTGTCVLAWAPGAAPDVLVTSVAASEIVARTDAFLHANRWVGYARCIWAPDRFGRLELQAASALPGPGLQLALEDGLDFPALAYAAAAGNAVPAAQPRLQLTRRLPMLDPGLAGESSVLVELSPRPAARDPLPWMASLLRSLVRT